MSHAYTTVGWENFFFAELGAAAALLGLLFVAVSINLKQIISTPSLPGRAGEALMMLLTVLALGTFALVPGQSIATLGAEILGFTLLVWFGILVIHRIAYRAQVSGREWIGLRVLSAQLGLLPLLTAGLSLIVGAGGGLYWTVPGVLLSLMAALLDAWVLLVEIQR